MNKAKTKSAQILPLLLLQLFLFFTAFAQKPADIKNAREVINNVITAMGGKEYLLTIKTLYTDMSTEMEGRQVHWITKEMLPNKGSFQIVYNNRIVFQNWYDGENGYELVNGEKTKADENEFKDKKFKRNIFDELDYLDTSLWKLELAGEGKVNKEDCYKIKATLVNGLVKILYISKATFYTLREDKISNAEKGSFTTAFFSDFQKFGHLTYYATLRLGEGKNSQTVKIIKLLPNEKITNSDFN